MSDQVYMGKAKLNFEKKDVKGFYTELNGEDYFKIENYDQMRAFFMTIVSSSDHWLFISSNGALSAGRRNPDNALFPYYTDDKITDSVGITGSKTILRVEDGEKTYLWEPFSQKDRHIYNSSFNLFKNREGSRIIFEEINHDLNLCFRYGWMFSEKYGIVKKSFLINLDTKKRSIGILDGVQNILPYGVESKLQGERSNLVDAYKRTELDVESELAIYSLSSMIVDNAEPSESLKANTAWSSGIEYKSILLSSLQISDFIEKGEVQTENDIKAEKGAFFIQANVQLKTKESIDWAIVGELEQSVSKIEVLRKELKDRKKIYSQLEQDISNDKEAIRRKIGLADGIQLSKDRLSSGRHFSNVLFNIMRGGNFDDQYNIETADFIAHLKSMNKKVYNDAKNVLEALPDHIPYHQLRHFLSAAKQKDIMRYYYAYLPLTFSRRHGDPSRPWNFFSIEIKDENGKKIRNFEGNWRDIFQNWEALIFSYPEFSLGMISKFVNASTIDGYNPYRISRAGIDWEVIEEDDPWSYIGYWGDHQVIYLTKFLEFSLNYHPNRLRDLLSSEIFTYANVPYRIKGYDAIISDPKDTIDYKHHLEADIKKKEAQYGAEGKMVWNRFHELEKANLTEKLMVMILTKLYNFVPEGGIWLNTQRPEWNDANNALVGNGLSMVTLYYLRRLLNFLPKLYNELESQTVEVNKPVTDLMESLRRGFSQHHNCLKNGFNNEQRRNLMDDFGVAGEHYRTTAYAGFTGDKRKLKIKDLLSFVDLAREFLEHSIDKNEREDGLYHAYNLLTLTEGTATISPLYEMLEGQVAVLSAAYLKEDAVVKLLNALKSSKMFREKQYSYMLYPDRDLDGFLVKNNIPAKLLQNSELAKALVSRGDKSIIEQDINGNYHFNGNFHNVRDLNKALERLEDVELHKLAIKETELWRDCFEKVFDHRSFTGRSGTFYGYEGLGSIYWHMVSKLLLSLQENIYLGVDQGWSKGSIGQMIEHYYEIRAGIGINKSPKLYGAFPTDAYSHTPKYAGAKQPGMTGQVKEDVINRWAELGVVVKNGRLGFDPHILRKGEFLDKKASLSYYDLEGKRNRLEVEAGGMAFTYCQIPIEYRIADEKKLTIHYADGSSHEQKHYLLSELDSKDVFKRTGKVQKIQMSFSEESLLP